MSRAERRNLKRVAARALKRAKAGSTRSLSSPPPASVTLSGGPMDGWVVKPDAPALNPQWCLFWPPSVAAKNAPGQGDADGPRRAKWVPL